MTLSSFLFTRKHGFSFVRLDGTMSQKKRTRVIQEFQSAAADSPAIMLLSLKAGGVGLNLTAASHVFFMDPVSADLGHKVFFNTLMKIKHNIVEAETHSIDGIVNIFTSQETC